MNTTLIFPFLKSIYYNLKNKSSYIKTLAHKYLNDGPEALKMPTSKIQAKMKWC